MSSVTIYHNPRCSKSRQTLALLTNRGVSPKVIHYLDAPPTAATLSRLLKMLGMTPRQLLRTHEAAYSELGLDDAALSDAELVAAMTRHPVLIERPIVEANGHAVIGRPPENVLQII